MNIRELIPKHKDDQEVIEELKNLGYTNHDLKYTNYEDGRHDVETWGKAMPGFLLWAWGKK